MKMHHGQAAGFKYWSKNHIPPPPREDDDFLPPVNRQHLLFFTHSFWLSFTILRSTTRRPTSLQTKTANKFQESSFCSFVRLASFTKYHIFTFLQGLREETIHRLNFEWLNFERPNFVRLNFERPNFERLNFERHNFERPNFERLNFERLNFERLNFEKDRTFHDRTSNRTELRKIFGGSLKILHAIANTVYI